MEPHPLFLVSLVVFIGFMCFALLAFGVFVFIFITNLSNVGNMLTAELSAPPSEDFLASAILRPWEPSAFGDLSCRWKGDWHDITRPGGYEGYTRGVVKSLRDPDGPGWLAFAIDRDHRRERKGIIILKTGAQRVELNVSGQRLNPNVQVQARVDGMEWGSMTVTHPTCLYHSADRATEARWAPVFRPKLAFVFTKLIAFDPDYYPLIVNNRPVAALADMWIRNPRVGAQKPFPAALQSVDDNLNPNEQGILLMMLGMSLYFDALRTNRFRQDW